MTKEAVEKLILKQVIKEFNASFQSILSDPKKLAEFAKEGFMVSIETETAEKAKEILANDPGFKFEEDIKDVQKMIDFYQLFFNTGGLDCFPF